MNHQTTSMKTGKERPRLWTRNYILVCLSSLILFFSFHSLIPTLPLYMELMGGKSGTAGLPLAALTIGAVLTRPLAGWALDYYGRRAIFLGGLLLFLLPAVIYIWMIPAFFLIVMRFVQGIGWGIGNTASNTVASDIIPLPRMGEGMGIFMVTITLPMAISPAVSLWIVEQHSFPLLFTISALLVVVSLVLMLFINIPPLQKQNTKPKFVFMERASAKPALAILMLTMTYSSVLSFLSVYANQRGVHATGLFFSAMAVSTLLIRPAMGVFVDKRGEKGYNLAVLLGCIAISGALAVLAQTASVSHLVIGGILFGVGFGMGQPTLLALCIISAPAEKKGAANATYWTAYDIGIALGSIIWGLVAAATGYREMFYLNILPLLVALLIFFRQYTPLSPAGKDR